MSFFANWTPTVMFPSLFRSPPRVLRQLDVTRAPHGSVHEYPAGEDPPQLIREPEPWTHPTDPEQESMRARLLRLLHGMHALKTVRFP